MLAVYKVGAFLILVDRRGPFEVRRADLRRGTAGAGFGFGRGVELGVGVGTFDGVAWEVLGVGDSGGTKLDCSL